MVVYSPSPEYPADCCSGVEIPPIGAAGMNGKVNRVEAHQSEGGLISLYPFTLEWLRRNSALIPRSLLRGASLFFMKPKQKPDKIAYILCYEMDTCALGKFRVCRKNRPSCNYFCF